MKLYIVDPDGEAAGIAYRAYLCGHKVRSFIRDRPKTCLIGAGMFPITRRFSTADLDWADLILVAANQLYAREIDAWRRENPRAMMVGGVSEVSQWELDRTIGQEVLERCGVNVIPYQEFHDYAKAKAYVKRRDTRLVSKPFGDADKALSYVASGPDPVADLLFMLDKWETQGKIKA